MPLRPDTFRSGSHVPRPAAATATSEDSPKQMRSRIWLWQAGLMAVLAIFGVRLFYVQVIQYDHFKKAALGDQLKQYEIPAQRGTIKAYDGAKVVPIVLNQKLYTLFVDPTLVKHHDKYAAAVAGVVGGQPGDYLRLLQSKNTRYVILKKELNQGQSDKIRKLEYAGLGTEVVPSRTYPQGSLASQLLGFVNDEGVGQYGVEQALNKQLAGKAGMLKAITDVRGVPLAASQENIQQSPVPGQDVILSLDLGMQVQMEQILAAQAAKTKSQLLSAVIMDVNTGKIKAMANFPTYDPANRAAIKDPNVLQNAAVTNAIEPGSIMKPLTTAAALDQGVISALQSYYDPASWLVNGFRITNIEEDGGARPQTVASVLYLSLNTGVVWELMQMGKMGGTSITMKGINAWHSYMTDHYQFGKETGVEQGYESAGVVPPADPEASALALTYANTSFGQAMQVTALQMAAALAASVNGGTYYQPSLVAQYVGQDGKATAVAPKVTKSGVVSAKTSSQLIPLMEQVVTHYRDAGYSFMNFPDNYIVGGKTGTAQIAKPGGGYDDHNFNGTYLGFVGGTKPQYVICVFNTKPQVAGYAGANAGQPVFADLAHALINGGYVSPKN